MVGGKTIISGKVRNKEKQGYVTGFFLYLMQKKYVLCICYFLCKIE